MLIVDKNTSNDWVLNLQEKSQIYNLSGTSPYYLFSLTSDTTSEVVNFVADNIAPLSARSRYDEFTIIETGSTYTNLTGGTIHLTPEVFWSFNVYEQTTRNNLDISQTVSLVETRGKIYVRGVEESPNTYYSPTGSTSYITYNNNY